MDINAHRVFAPANILNEAACHGLVLTEFQYLEKIFSLIQFLSMIIFLNSHVFNMHSRIFLRAVINGNN